MTSDRVQEVLVKDADGGTREIILQGYKYRRWMTTRLHSCPCKFGDGRTAQDLFLIGRTPSTLFVIGVCRECEALDRHFRTRDEAL